MKNRWDKKGPKGGKGPVGGPYIPIIWPDPRPV